MLQTHNLYRRVLSIFDTTGIQSIFGYLTSNINTHSSSKKKKMIVSICSELLCAILEKLDRPRDYKSFALTCTLFSETAKTPFLITRMMNRCVQRLMCDTENGFKCYSQLCNEVLHGQMVHYTPMGEVLATRMYRNGVLCGTSVDRDLLSMIETHKTYVDNVLSGPCIIYSIPDYRVIRSYAYKNNEIHGESRVYSKTGVLIQRTEYENGRLHGRHSVKIAENSDAAVTTVYVHGKIKTVYKSNINGKRLLEST